MNKTKKLLKIGTKYVSYKVGKKNTPPEKMVERFLPQYDAEIIEVEEKYDEFNTKVITIIVDIYEKGTLKKLQKSESKA